MLPDNYDLHVVYHIEYSARSPARCWVWMFSILSLRPWENFRIGQPLLPKWIERCLSWPSVYYSGTPFSCYDPVCGPAFGRRFSEKILSITNCEVDGKYCPGPFRVLAISMRLLMKGPKGLVVGCVQSEDEVTLQRALYPIFPSPDQLYR